MLGVTPKIALVNEIAFSTGMVDIYAEASYEGIVMDQEYGVRFTGVTSGCNANRSWHNQHLIFWCLKND